MSMGQHVVPALHENGFSLHGPAPESEPEEEEVDPPDEEHAVARREVKKSSARPEMIRMAGSHATS
jgi:hypothetical protein